MQFKCFANMNGEYQQNKNQIHIRSEESEHGKKSGRTREVFELEKTNNAIVGQVHHAEWNAIQIKCSRQRRSESFQTENSFDLEYIL